MNTKPLFYTTFPGFIVVRLIQEPIIVTMLVAISLLMLAMGRPAVVPKLWEKLDYMRKESYRRAVMASYARQQHKQLTLR